MKNKSSENISELISFIKKSPSCFHAVENIAEILAENSFSELKEAEKWNLKAGGKYFIKRNGSSIIAFALPEKVYAENNSFNIVASHSDSPVFKIKENPERKSAECVILNVEKYGGMLINPWFDRPLSVAGRIAFEKDGKICSKNVNIDRDLLMIPNLAIHMNRDANDGHKVDVQNEIEPVLSLNQNLKLKDLLAQETGVKAEEIMSWDLFLYNRSESSVWGGENEFFSAAKIDDLECAFTTLKGFVQAKKIKNTAVYCCFDNEEVGSQSRQGAASTFLKDVLVRINLSLGGNKEDYLVSLAKSFMVSADNAHALHPNYVSAADPVNRPEINGGIVIKFNAAQKYTSDGLTSAFFKSVCRKADVPVQIFTNNSNVAGGSTLGNISQSQVSVPCVDIGLAQWAMHSPYETAGVKDAEYMEKAVTEFYISLFEMK